MSVIYAAAVVPEISRLISQSREIRKFGSLGQKNQTTIAPRNHHWLGVRTSGIRSMKGLTTPRAQTTPRQCMLPPPPSCPRVFPLSPFPRCSLPLSLCRSIHGRINYAPTTYCPTCLYPIPLPPTPPITAPPNDARRRHARLNVYMRKPMA